MRLADPRENGMALPYAEQPLYDLTPSDDAEIDARVEDRAKKLALSVTQERAAIEQMLADVLDDEDGAHYLRQGIREILEGCHTLQEEASCYTDAERIARFLTDVQAAVMPLARIEAESHREAIEDRYIREGMGL